MLLGSGSNKRMRAELTLVWNVCVQGIWKTRNKYVLRNREGIYKTSLMAMVYWKIS
jgi:hypothetical protein